MHFSIVIVKNNYQKITISFKTVDLNYNYTTFVKKDIVFNRQRRS